MNEPTPDRDLERDFDLGGDPDALPDPSLIPRWIPVLIGVILATMAALAVFTGLRYRDDGTLASHVQSPRPRPATAAPPGEPGAGASLVMPGGNTPVAGEPVRGESRTVIEGSAAGVQAVPRFRARRGMVLDLSDSDAMVYVNDVPIGQVRQFDTMDEVYDFAEPGSYVVRVVGGGQEKKFVVTAGDDAPQDVARIR